MLIGRGLSAPEAKAHIAQVVDSRKTPLFAPAIVLAGLDVGDVTPTSVKEEEAKAAELESIYGGGQMAQPSSAFAPPTASPSFSAGSQAAAADAMALLNDEAPLEQPTPLQTKPDFADDLMPAEAPQTVVKSGGVQLPQGMEAPAPAPTPALVPETKPAPTHATSLTCQACNAAFSVTLPDGVKQAVVACPACNVDNIVNA